MHQNENKLIRMITMKVQCKMHSLSGLCKDWENWFLFCFQFAKIIISHTNVIHSGDYKSDDRDRSNLPLAAYYHLFINYILYYIISLTLKSKVCISKWPLSDGRRQIQAEGDTFFSVYKICQHFIEQRSLPTSRHSYKITSFSFCSIEQWG